MISLALTVAVLIASASATEICDENEEYLECGSACPLTCENYGKISNCTEQCVPGCFCKAFLLENKLTVPKCSIPEMCFKGKEECNDDEEFNICGSSCPDTCDNYGKPRACPKICLRGCFCKTGLVRNKDSKCVPLERCEKTLEAPTALEAATGVCPNDEVYLECGSACPLTCENYGKPSNCSKECVPGCFCKDFLVRNKLSPQCLIPEMCFNRTCNDDEEYKRCGTACPDTCENYGKFRICPRLCVFGCFCQRGLVRNKDLKCVIPERCERKTCNDDEEFQSCGSSCPDTCDNYGKSRACTDDCVPGCFCKKGLIRNSDFKCVMPERCDNRICRKDEVYLECGSACPLTCENYGKPIICTKECVFGCFCKEGLVRREDGQCVTPEICPKETCNDDEEYQSCGSACPDTCDNYGKPRICPLISCVRGCFCKRGLVRNRDLKCVIPEGCDKKTCNDDEEFQSCGSSCPDTCDNYGKPRICPLICVRGCFCKRGLVRNEDFKCVIPERCENTSAAEPGLCRKDEVYLECGSACPLTCENYGKPIICTEECVSGCFCKEGLVRRQDGQCVIPEICRKETCNDDEEFASCGSACPDTCDNYGKPRYCPLICVRGCFCKRGLVRNRDLTCVIPERCRKETCNDDEFQSRGSPCPDTCDNYGKTRTCTLDLIEGCFCKRGLVRNNYLKCVTPESCEYTLAAETGICRKDEVYLECGSACPLTCENYGKPIFCTKECVSGCFCKKGLVRRQDGQCVVPEICPKHTCSNNEEFQSCGTIPAYTCDNYGKRRIFPPICNEGCFCQKGLLRNCDMKCVIPERCGKETCNDDEEFQSCGSSCPDTCDNYGKPRICPLICVQGCFCKRGLVRNSDFQCVMPEKCDNKLCNDDEEYQSCGSACPDTCDNYGKPRICPLISCVPGCFCKSGLVRNSALKCVIPERCHKKTCNDDELQSSGPSCPDTCENYGKPRICTLDLIHGCFCKKGLVRNNYLKCVTPESCDNSSFGCTRLRTQVLPLTIGEVPQTCFSTKPVSECAAHCKATGTVSHKVSFHCLPAEDDFTKVLLREREIRVLFELSRKSKDQETIIEVPDRCYKE